MIEKYLMTFEEYNKMEHTVPYTYSLTKNNQHLFYFGARHSFDPKDPQYILIKKYWTEFLEKTNEKNIIVFVEGGKRPVALTPDEAILKGGEPDFITYLASQVGVETYSPEPPEKLRLEILLKKFTKEEIVYYEFARMALQWNNLVERPDFDTYVGGSLEKGEEISGWHDVDFSLAHMKKIQKEKYGRDFKENDKEFFYDIINPTTTMTRINELSRFEDSGLRDSYILQEIEKYWREGKNIFIVYGASHAVMHQKAVEGLVEI